jgi:hypothetical protein
LKEEKFKPVVSPVQNISPENSHPWIYQHRKLLTEISAIKSWDQKKLINKLNHINFIDGYIFTLFRHNETGEQILIKAYPQPSIKDEFVFRLDSQESLIDLTKYSFDYLMIDDGLTTISAQAQLVNMGDSTLKLKLPAECKIEIKRKTKRFLCQDITCEIIQGKVNIQGTLIDFTPSSLGIKLNGNRNTQFDENNHVSINLYQNGTKLFSNSCQCIRNIMDSPDGRVVFTPLNKQMALFPKRKIRNPRQQIAASFAIRFMHPFFNKTVERDIFEISTSGFSIRDNTEEEILIPGMIIPHATIVYTGILKMECSLQVVYRREDPESNMVQCGLAITDMDIQSYTRFNHILGAYLDGNARVSTYIDMDALWEFFFDTGFIYSEKYQHLQPYREIFKETYKKLYQDNQDIARHFVYAKNGKIYGHMSMVHAYNPSWLMHHFAARPMEGKIAGLKILRQITHYINGLYRFPSGGMDYIMAYYRPENEIMNTIFGGFASYFGNPKGSSVDLFSYSYFHKDSFNQALPSDWILREYISSDFDKLTDFYEEHSGGLLLDALDLNSPMQLLRDSFIKAGFKRNCQTFCLCFKEEQIAFFIVNQSDLGLNLSDLLNGIKIIIINEAKLKWDIVTLAINKISSFYEEKQISLLVYPSDYLSRQGIRADKNYQLWILKISSTSDQYHEYMKSKFRIKYRTE